MAAACGSADLCFITSVSIPDGPAHLARCDTPAIEGPVAREGATGPSLSVYVLDHDAKLIEISHLTA